MISGRFLTFWVVIPILTLPFLVSAQKYSLKETEILFESAKYHDALQGFLENNKTVNDKDLLIKRGICYLHTNQPDKCIRDMIAANNLNSKDNKMYKYVAMAYQSKKEYGQAAKYYKYYLNTLKKDQNDWQKTIDLIRQCGKSENYKFVSQMGYIENLGNKINTIYDEFHPIQSPTRINRIYFNSKRETVTGGLRDNQGKQDDLRGHYASDIFMADLENGNWSDPQGFGNLVNSTYHEILQDFSPDASVMYYVKSIDGKIGSMMTDTFNLDKSPSKMTNESGFPFYAEKEDRDLYFYNDSTLFFSSKTYPGYGGFDIFYATKSNGKWQQPQNMGALINTEADEISPYLIRNGSKLFFSSDRIESLGGFDIYIAQFASDGNLQDVTNAGYPINSPGNDVGMEISMDGVNGFFASNRIEGFGGYDLYMAYFKNQEIGQLLTTDIPSFIHQENTPSLPTSNKISNAPTENISLPDRDYISKPLYFSQNEDILNVTNANQLKTLVELMNIYPEIQVDLYSHFIEEGKKSQGLYFSVKRAEKVSQYLEKSGVNPARIKIYGCGANYPLAIPMINGIASTLAERTNKRIDIRLHFPKDKNLHVMYDYPVVAVQYRDTLWDHFNDNLFQLQFRVKFAETTQMLQHEIINNLSDILIEKTPEDAYYKYTMGNFKSIITANKWIGILEKQGFEKCTLLAFMDGKQLSSEEAKNMVSDYPVLADYLLFTNKQ